MACWDKLNFVSSIILASAAIGITIYFSIQINSLTEEAFRIENFPLNSSFTSNAIILEQRRFDQEPVNTKLSLSIISPHFLELTLESVSMTDINSKIIFAKSEQPRVELQKDVKVFLSNGITNLDLDVPVVLSFLVEEREQGENRVGTIEYRVKIVDLQSKAPIAETIRATVFLKPQRLFANFQNENDVLELTFISATDNKDHETVDRVYASALSFSETGDIGMLDFILSETGPNTGIFAGSGQFDMEVNEGDDIVIDVETLDHVKLEQLEMVAGR